MSDVTIARAFAEAAARLTSANDVAGNLVALLNDCAALVRADAAGLLVQLGDDSLDLLSSTSHQATDLELYELQTGHGPCIEAIKQNEVVSVTSPALAGLWPPVGKAFSDAGYHAVHAFPLRWQNRAIGALNVFARTADPLDRDLSQVGQGFARSTTRQRNLAEHELRQMRCPGPAPSRKSVTNSARVRGLGRCSSERPVLGFATAGRLDALQPSVQPNRTNSQSDDPADCRVSLSARARRRLTLGTETLVQAARSDGPRGRCLAGGSHADAEHRDPAPDPRGSRHRIPQNHR
jgi:GAF domain